MHRYIGIAQILFAKFADDIRIHIVMLLILWKKLKTYKNVQIDISNISLANKNLISQIKEFRPLA